MKKIILHIAILCCFNIPAAAQIDYGKLGATLKILLSARRPSSPLITTVNGISYIPVLLQFTSSTAPRTIAGKQLYVRTQMGDVATADVAIADINSLLASDEIKRIELPLLFHKTDTVMQKMTTAYSVLNGTAPLDSAYTGKNTVIGIIDDGFDFTHPDFNTPQDKSRFLSIWNMDYNHLPPAGFGYGNEWLPDSLEYYKQQFKNHQVSNYSMEQLFNYCFHGTSVAGLAAGNNGIAKGADMVGVALTAFEDTLLRSDRILDAIRYIYGKAQSVHKKCIINISLGVLDGGAHDGKTLLEKAIDNFCIEKTDILVCTSAGNEGNNWRHWGGFPINKDSSFCFFRGAYEGSLYFTIPRQYTDRLSLSFTDSKMGDLNNPAILRDSIIGQTSYVNIGSIINNPSPTLLQIDFPNGAQSSSFQFAASHYSDLYDELVVKINEYTSTNTAIDFHLFRFIWKGEGMVHCWFPFVNIAPQFLFENNPLPGDSTFRLSDNDYTTVIPSNAYTVLSSGAYNIRNCYVNLQKKVVTQYDKCRTAYFTSHGPTLDGRVKPDVITPGDNVLAPRKRFDSFFDFDFIVDSNTVMFSGTSASSPITAGIAALVWEKFPSYSREQLIEKIKSTADFDHFCQDWGAQPNNVAGMGKVDAFKAMTGLSTDHSADCDIPDLCASVTPPADTTTIPVVPPLTTNFFSVYPNPANNLLYVQYRFTRQTAVHLFNYNGQLVMSRVLPSTNNTSSATARLPTARLAAGIYVIRITDQQAVFTKKIFIRH